MKIIAPVLLVIVLLGLADAPTRADTTYDADFTSKIVHIFNDCEKVKPGMTRADLAGLELFEEDDGPLQSRNDSI